MDTECTGRPNCSAKKHYLSCHIWYSKGGMTNFIAKKFPNDDCEFCRLGKYHLIKQCVHKTLPN
jgi:hypothetical protein